MKGLTQKQQSIAEYIRDFIDKHRFSPSYRQIMRHFGFSSVGTVYKHIQALKRKGAVCSDGPYSNSLYLPESQKVEFVPTDSELPLVGMVHLGQRIEMFSQTRNVAVPQSMITPDVPNYVFQVHGSKLDEELMVDGDLVVVAATPNASAGDQVLAQVHGREVYIRRFYPEGQYIRLESYHKSENSLSVNSTDLLIHGIVTGLVRLY